jgi:predicted enzyme related to lactoylglutathione lyase
MIFGGRCCLAAALVLQASVVVAAPAPVVFFDIAAPNLPSQAAFYHDIFDWKIAPAGTFSVPVASPLPANLRVEPASQGLASERVIYIGVPDINATLAKIEAHGGSIVFPRQVVPGVVILALFKDPAGNRMGLVEMDGVKPRIPPAH